MPQYKKAVLKADIHRGVNLVESLYQAQQAYYLANGYYAWNIDDLDVTFPKDASCTKTEKIDQSSRYDCDFGTILNKISTSIQFQTKSNKASYRGNNIAYVRFLHDTTKFKEGQRACYAHEESKYACINMGGTYLTEDNVWIYYNLD